MLKNAKVSNGKTKKLCDKHLVLREFELDQSVLLLKSRLKLLPGKLKNRWCGPYKVVCATRHGDVEFRDPIPGDTFLVKE